jgi:hypothetical protein
MAASRAAVPLMPVCRPAMQVGDPIGFAPVQLYEQQIWG